MIPRSYCVKCNAKYNTETLGQGQMFACQRCGTTVVVGQKTSPEAFAATAAPAANAPVASNDNADPMIGKVIDGIKLTKALGKGAAGVVYYGKNGEGKEIAVKTLHPKFAKQERIIKRFKREAESGLKLKHKHFVEFYSFGEFEGYNYITMEFIDGSTLKDLLKEEGQMNDRTKMLVGLHVAKALAFAYDNKMVHRDIKPDNIMITKDGVAKLTDMGLAKEVYDEEGGGEDMSLTKTGVTLGTPYYMPPEQIQDSKRADCRSDIYSLGATLFHLFGGRPPYFGGGMMDVMKKIMEDPIPKLKDLKPEIDQNVSDLIYKMIQRNANDRYASPHILIKDIQRVLDGKPLMGKDELSNVFNQEDAAESARVNSGKLTPEPEKAPAQKVGFFGKLLQLFGLGKK